MTRIFLNGLAASAGAGLTYLHNVVPQLSAKEEVFTILAVQPGLKAQFENLPRVDVVSPARALSTGRRFWFEQRQLPKLIHKLRADVLISAGNFALRRSPVPQILLSGNSLYTSSDFYRDLRSRHEYRMLADNFIRGMLAKNSVRWADITIAPSSAFAGELRHWTKKNVLAIHHGFDRKRFLSGARTLTPEIQSKLGEADGCLRLLFVSHYNYYRNFETLLRAVPRIKQRLQHLKVKLILTCKLEAGSRCGGYDPRSAARLVQTLGIRENVVDIGAIPYDSLHHLYRACDLYVTPAYAETFAHPLVEAMACGLPVIASDLPVHREVCGDAARYFSRFSPELLADTLVEVAASEDLRARLTAAGLQRSSEFSWEEHVTELLVLAAKIQAGPAKRSRPKVLDHCDAGFTAENNRNSPQRVRA